MDFISNIKTAPFSIDKVFAKVSDLNNLKGLRQETEKGVIEFEPVDSDRCHIKVSSMAQLTLKVVDRTPTKQVKLETEQSPISATLWIQLLPHKEQSDSTLIKITLRAELNILIKGMVQKPLQEAIEKLAQVLESIDYDHI